MMFHILVAEDDKDLRDLFCTVLSDRGYEAIPAEDGEDALEILDHQYIDLIISDIMMPKIDGYELIRQLRDAGYTLPILIITAKGALSDKKEGFLAGTDDYMVKPIDVHEMIWRVEALLRRSQIAKDRKFQLGGTLFDCDTLSVSHGENTVILPQKEFFLIYRLITSAGKIFTKRQLFEEIWGLDSETRPAYAGGSYQPSERKVQRSS